MQLSDIEIAIPSYKRAGDVSTLDLIPDQANVWVPASQVEEYELHYPGRVVGIEDDLDGNIARKRNAILDLSPADFVLMLDDDIRFVGRFEDGEHDKLDPQEFEWLILEGFRMAKEAGVRLWGINQNSDPMTYRTMTPFSFLATILGPFCGHLNPELRYDEKMSPKEDYDFWLWNIYHYRKTFRMNKYHYLAGHGAQSGGLAALRSMDREWSKARLMRKRWGKHFRAQGSKGGKSATGANILNSLAKPGIPGT